MTSSRKVNLIVKDSLPITSFEERFIFCIFSNKASIYEKLKKFSQIWQLKYLIFNPFNNMLEFLCTR